MMRKLFVVVGLAAPVGLLPAWPPAREGHNQGVKAKKVKKSKPKKRPVESPLRHPAA
jgi:hypothetical protein